MPDVKWYAGGDSGGGLTISTTTVTGGTNNRLLRQAGGVVGNSLLSDDGSNVTLSSGALILPDGTSGNPVIVRAAGGPGMYQAAAYILFSDGTTGLARITTNNGQFETQSGGYFGFGNSQNADSWTVDTTLNRHASGSVRVSSGAGAGAASLVIGASSHPATPASNYLFIEGVSGAGGTPTTSHLTAGSGIAIYTQQTHDAAATVFVIAYNLGGSMRYISIPLDGTTATWTHNATRP